MNMPENSYQNQKNLFAENYDLEHYIAEEFFVARRPKTQQPVAGGF